MEGEEELKEKALQARCIRWMMETLQESPDQELYFGSLTKALHDNLKDDLGSYRKDVKVLIQNMLSYCERYLIDYIKISRPSHSQKVKLLVA